MTIWCLKVSSLSNIANILFPFVSSHNFATSFFSQSLLRLDLKWKHTWSRHSHRNASCSQRFLMHEFYLTKVSSYFSILAFWKWCHTTLMMIGSSHPLSTEGRRLCVNSRREVVFHVQWLAFLGLITSLGATAYLSSLCKTFLFFPHFILSHFNAPPIAPFLLPH